MKVTALLLLLAIAIGLVTIRSRAIPQSGSPPTQTPADSKTPTVPAPLLAEDVYNNVKLMKGKPATVMIPAMIAIRGSLGVQCSYCHLPHDWADESVPQKQRAREMFDMLKFINHTYFNDANGVTCWSCHRALPKPAQIAREPEALAATAAKMKIPPADENKPAEQVFHNIQRLKGVPAGRIPMIMTMFSASLGVQCSHCHADDFASDAKPEKTKARQMLGMSRGIARQFYNGNSPVGCFTCHQGKVTPEFDAGKPTEAKMVAPSE